MTNVTVEEAEESERISHETIDRGLALINDMLKSGGNAEALLRNLVYSAYTLGYEDAKKFIYVDFDDEPEES